MKVHTWKTLIIHIMLLPWVGLLVFAAQPPRPIPDSMDLKNEFAIVRERLGNIEKLEEERFTNLNKQMDRLLMVFGGLAVFFLGGSFLQMESVKRANQRSIDKSMEVAESKFKEWEDKVKSSKGRSFPIFSGSERTQ